MIPKMITGLQNPLVKHLVRLKKDSAYRKESGSVLVEGKKILSELPSEIKIKTLIVTDFELVPKGISCNEIIQVNPAVFKKICHTISPEGIAAEIMIPEPKKIDDLHRIVALDRVSDPGNLGTICRTALALGWEAVFLLTGCCDLWNDKVIRASKGAVFKIPFVVGDWDELADIMHRNKMTGLAADLEGELPEKFSEIQKIVLVLGNESEGLSKEAGQFCKRVTIPIDPGMESLNVSIAGGILMYALKGNI